MNVLFEQLEKPESNPVPPWAGVFLVWNAWMSEA